MFITITNFLYAFLKEQSVQLQKKRESDLRLEAFNIFTFEKITDFNILKIYLI